jgi:hypothetical protein
LNRCFYTAKILLPGLVTAQIIATIQVHLSNAEFFHTLVSIRNAGYLVIPNRQVMQGLLELGPAFYGGLFFTLSVGAGLSVLTLVAAWIWACLFSRRKIFLLLFLVPWTGLIVGINLKGFCPIITSYFLFIPPIVFVTALRCIPVRLGKRKWLNKMALIIPIIVPAFLWIRQMDSGLFLNIRDHLLLSNRVGTTVNDFYYTYTLYPATVFKSLNQKILKTCSLEHITENNLADLLRKELINYDFLDVNANAAIDLMIVKQGNILVFKNKRKMILKTSIKDFLSGPGNTLREFSLRTDRHGFFRCFTLFSLLTGFPAVLFVACYTILAFILCAFLDYRRSSVISVCLCLIAGIVVCIFFQHSTGRKVGENNLSEALTSVHWQDKVAAVKNIQQKKMDIGRFGTYKDILTSPRIPVRYWLARALGTSRGPGTYKDLLILLDDPCPNVVCMAFHSLGQRGKKSIIKEIVKRIQTSDRWYEQWYAYKALRTLGWKQAKLK